MKLKTVSIFLVALTFFLVAGLPLLVAQEPQPPSPAIMGKIDPRLLKQLLNADDSQHSIIIEMKAQAELKQTAKVSNALSRRTAIVTALKLTAHESQIEVMALLNQAQKSQGASDIKSLWLINAVAAKTNQSTIYALASLDEVALIRLDETISLPEIEYTEVSQPEAESVAWGIDRIQADEVWQSLGIDGTGIVVANLDTGVDFLHPSLQNQYRGYNGATLPAIHHGNWYDSSGGESTYPVDSNGHGTHTMGTMVASEGIGVAPGAQWIAVKSFSNAGVAHESWLHDAFQWIMAPEGDTTLAPDIVNNSWSNALSDNTVFEEDVELLLMAGIIPVFSAGNNGPNSKTVGAPASYNLSFAVGASDPDDVIASFSGRGPSPWGKIKPDVVGPGVNVLSTIPGGVFGLANGTSMAAPHVSGLIALLLEAKPQLSYPEISNLLTATTQPLGNQTPNNNYGWGIVNAYSALEMTLNTGQLTGIVYDTDTLAPVSGAKITLSPNTSGLTNTFTTNNQGSFKRGVVEGNYNASITAFGYYPETVLDVAISNGQVITHNFAISPFPKGQINGYITQADNSQPISATILVNQTPVSVSSNINNGRYNLNLPAGTYTLTVLSLGYHTEVVQNITVIANSTTVQNISLITAPTILLVDSGPWYNMSEISYYQQTLDTLRYSYDTHRIKFIPADVPISSTLSSYDIVIWSAPLDSPGLVGGGPAIEGYLDKGGQLLLSGQDVAYYDAGGTFSYAPYYSTHLKGTFLKETDNLSIITGTQGEIFQSLSFGLAGDDSANNQTFPDVIQNIGPDYASQVLEYSTVGSAGQKVGHCQPYRAVTLPFGFEAIASTQIREDLLQETFNWFESSRRRDGFSITPLNQSQYGTFGQTLSYTFRIRNEAEFGPADTLSYEFGGHNWPISFPYTNTTLLPCQTVWLTFTVNVPTDANWNDQDVLTLNITSALSPALQAEVGFVSKAQSPLLLVDDDRWFDAQDAFVTSLIHNGVQPDVWTVQEPSYSGSPPLSLLQQYPTVIWFNAYDWFSPLSQAEEATLQQYLNGGGRLFFSSQEYLYNLPQQKPSQFAQNYLGVYTYTESLSSTSAVGVAGNPIGNAWGPYKLTFPPGYLNWTDSLTPTAAAQPATLNQLGLANGLTHQGGLTETWHSAFFAYGPELLADEARHDLIERIVGWLSWLGASTLNASATQATNGDIITYTAVIKNDGLTGLNNTAFTATFPAPLSLVPGSVTGPASEANGQVLWSGPLAKNEVLTLTYQASISPTAPYGSISEQVSWLHIRDHGFKFKRLAAVPVNMPNWANTSATVNPTEVALNNRLTYTLHLENSGLVDAPLVTVTAQIPPHLLAWPISATQGTGSLGTGQMGGGELIWTTPVSRQIPVTLQFGAQVITIPYPFSYPLTFALDDNTGRDLQWTVQARVKPYSTYLPLIFK